MRARAQLARPRAADVDHADGVAVLLAEQRHGAERLRLVEREDARRDLEVVAHRVVRDLLDLGPRRVGQRLAPREVEAHVAGAVERSGLRRALAERVAQRGVHEVRRRVRLSRSAAVDGVDDRGGGLADADLARGDLDGVADRDPARASARRALRARSPGPTMTPLSATWPPDSAYSAVSARITSAIWPCVARSTDTPSTSTPSTVDSVSRSV